MDNGDIVLNNNSKFLKEQGQETVSPDAIFLEHIPDGRRSSLWVTFRLNTRVSILRRSVVEPEALPP